LSLELLRRHRRVWANKPVLARIYAPWFATLLDQVPNGGRALEVGAGPGFLGENARRGRPDARIVTMDVLPTPWGDLVGDGLRLPFRDRSLQAVLGLDLVHHLARPAEFFAEVARVLTPGGCLAVVEPWVTPLSYPVYRWMHQEGCRLSLDPWDPFGVGEGAKDAFEGDAAVVYRLVRTTSATRWAELGLRPPRVRVLNAFAYLLSLGFKRGSLLPPAGVPALQSLDTALEFAAPLLGLRAFVVWTSLSPGETSGDERRGGH
jgi:SAM-dependent methyltransferase